MPLRIAPSMRLATYSCLSMGKRKEKRVLTPSKRPVSMKKGQTMVVLTGERSLAELHPDGLGEAEGGELARAVIGEAGRADYPGGRGDGDDVALRRARSCRGGRP